MYRIQWRTLERELADIFRKEGLELDSEGGDVVVTDRGLILFSVTDLAKKLIDRGVL